MSEVIVCRILMIRLISNEYYANNWFSAVCWNHCPQKHRILHNIKLDFAEFNCLRSSPQLPFILTSSSAETNTAENLHLSPQKLSAGQFTFWEPGSPVPPLFAPLVLASGSAHVRPSTRPPLTLAEIFLDFLFSCCFITTAIQNHRRGCRRVSNFCMGS